jgi:hypothetical protein
MMADSSSPRWQRRRFLKGAAAAETLPGEGDWEVGDHRLQPDFWPFNHTPSARVLRREGVACWDYLKAAGIPSTFYDLPSNYRELVRASN